MFSVALAERYGPIESIILSNICWWVETNRKNGKHFYEGKYWTYGSSSAFENIFTYLSARQIRNVLTALREKGVLITGNFNKIRYDRTLWYTVTDEVMALYENRGAGDKGPPAEDGSAEWGKPRSHLPNQADGNGKNPVRIRQIGRIESPDLADRSAQKGGPIPLVNIGKEAVAAEKKPENAAAEEAGAAAAAAGLPKSEEEAIGAFRSNLEKIRPGMVLSESFYPAAVKWLAREALDSGYPAWLLKECESRSPVNLRGLFFKLFFEKDMAESYKKRNIPPPGKPAPELACPVCGETHRRDLPECPGCGFRTGWYEDAPEVAKRIRINALPPDIRREYEKEIRELSFGISGEAGFGKYKDQWAAIERKYHLIE
jgi:hypothetical protein